MDATTAEVSEGVKARTRRNRVDQVPQGVPKVKATMYLSEEAYERLHIHALKTRQNASVMVEKLITDNLRTYVVQKRGPAVGEAPANPPATAPVAVVVNLDAPAISADDIPAPTPGEGEGSPPLPAQPARKRRAG